MTTPTHGDNEVKVNDVNMTSVTSNLSARLLEMIADWEAEIKADQLVPEVDRDPHFVNIREHDIARMRAALSALPAAGGPCLPAGWLVNWAEDDDQTLVIHSPKGATWVTKDGDRLYAFAKAVIGCSIQPTNTTNCADVYKFMAAFNCEAENTTGTRLYDSDKESVVKALEVITTPQPSAAEDAAVGAQGGLVSGAVWLDGGVALVRVGSEDEWCRERGAQRMCFAAPAAEKGVDDAMVERACAESWPEARFTVEAMTDWPHADPLRRGHHQRVVRAALEAALTRQPVAEDEMVLVPREPTLASLQAAHLAYWGTTPSNHWHECSEPLWRKAYAAMLAAAPAATPTDGGEESNE